MGSSWYTWTYRILVVTKNNKFITDKVSVYNWSDVDDPIREYCREKGYTLIDSILESEYSDLTCPTSKFDVESNDYTKKINCEFVKKYKEWSDKYLHPPEHIKHVFLPNGIMTINSLDRDNIIVDYGRWIVSFDIVDGVTVNRSNN